MKKIILLAFAAVSFAACNDSGTEVTATDSDTSTTIENTTSANAYAPSEGDVTYREKKVKVYRNGDWVDADNDITLDNGVVVYRDGTAVKDGKEVELEDGVVVTKTGNFLDRTGQAIEDAWKDAKEATKKAGKEVKDAFDDNDKN